MLVAVLCAAVVVCRLIILLVASLLELIRDAQNERDGAAAPSQLCRSSVAAQSQLKLRRSSSSVATAASSTAT